MDPRITDFLSNQRICVLTTVLPDGTPHSATVHFASSTNPLNFIVWTEKNSRKCKHFEVGQKYPSSLVVGFSEGEFKTFQLEGLVQIVAGSELTKAYELYRSKFGGTEKYEGDENDAILKFEPKWWRYTEYKPKKLILES